MWGWIFPKKQQSKFGFDVSHHQGTIDWNKVVQNNPKPEFVFIKASEGTTYVDPRLLYNVNGAKSINIPWGLYHFATLNSTDVTNDSIAEARHFLDQVSKTGVPPLPLILDIEINKAQLSPGKVNEWVNTFFGELSGYNSALYSSTAFLDTNLPVNHTLGSKKLWLAQYSSRSTPKLPKGWNTYWIWQYSENGMIEGINSPVDVNKTKLEL